MSEETLKEKDANFLYDEFAVRLFQGSIQFRICTHIAAEGDPTDDATVHWPESRKITELRAVSLDQLVPENKKQ